MGATAAVRQGGLFGEDYDVSDAPESFGSSWRERAQTLRNLFDTRGGLLPLSACPDVLGISRQRIYQLIDAGSLELVKVESVPFITGRSIEAWEADEGKKAGGYARRRGGRWSKAVISVKVGSAIADVLVPDKK